MYTILLVTPEKDHLSELASTLEKQNDVDLSWVVSGEKALERISRDPTDLVVSDETLGDMTGLELAGKMLSVNPVIHCAVVSDLSSENFHEASEGLGILAQLPRSPHREQAEALLGRLKEIAGLSA